MTRPFRFLADATDSGSDTETIDSDFVVIMAALLCALICVLGLVAVARCAWIRRFSLNNNNNNNNTTASAAGGRVVSNEHHRAAANKGLKKKILRSLPVVNYSDQLLEKFTECAICLTDFATGDDVRVLPQCGHGFHVGCIDTWLGSHSSCPSCRQILVVVAAAASRCENCGGVPNRPCGGGEGGGTSSSSSGIGGVDGGAEREVTKKEKEESSSSACDANSFLP